MNIDIASEKILKYINGKRFSEAVRMIDLFPLSNKDVNKCIKTSIKRDKNNHVLWKIIDKYCNYGKYMKFNNNQLNVAYNYKNYDAIKIMVSNGWNWLDINEKNIKHMIEYNNELLESLMWYMTDGLDNSNILSLLNKDQIVEMSDQFSQMNEFPMFVKNLNKYKLDWKDYVRESEVIPIIKELKRAGIEWRVI